jgi:hypothetical protein
MNRLLLLAAFLISAFASIAQTPKLIAAFNNLPAENRNHITIKKITGKWIGVSGETEQKLTVKLNATGAYLEIKDPGTGGGVSTFQMKIFKNNAGKEFIAFNKSWTDGVMFEGGISFIDFNGNDATLSYWPDYGEELNFKQGQSKEGNEDYFTGEYSYCNIPEAGNTIEIIPGYQGITSSCINDDKKACELKKKLVEKIVFVWAKEHDMFMPK